MCVCCVCACLCVEQDDKISNWGKMGQLTSTRVMVPGAFSANL